MTSFANVTSIILGQTAVGYGGIAQDGEEDGAEPGVGVGNQTGGKPMPKGDETDAV